MSLEETQEEHDRLEEVDGFKFVLDQRADLYLGNATIDYQVSPLGEGFSIASDETNDGCC